MAKASFTCRSVYILTRAFGARMCRAIAGPRRENRGSCSEFLVRARQGTARARLATVRARLAWSHLAGFKRAVPAYVNHLQLPNLA